MFLLYFWPVKNPVSAILRVAAFETYGKPSPNLE